MTNAAADVWIMPASGGEPELLVSDPAEDITPCFDPASQWVYFTSSRSGILQLYRVPIAGGAATQVTQNGGFTCQGSQDGRHLYYLKTRAGGEIRAYGKRIEDTIAASPHALAPLQLQYLRWVLFDIGEDKYFMYQGIFDTDFDKYTEDAIQLFKATGVDTVFEKLEGFPREDERARVHHVRARAPVSEFPRVRRISVRVGR